MYEFFKWITGSYLLYLLLVFILNFLINKFVIFLLFRQKKQRLYELTEECKRMEYRVEKLKAELKKFSDSKKE